MQKGLDILSDYCQKWKLTVNIDKTKVMVFRKGGILPRNLSFTFQGNMIEIVNKFVYLGISFSTGGSFTETHKTLSGQALKAIFKLNQYLYGKSHRDGCTEYEQLVCSHIGLDEQGFQSKIVNFFLPISFNLCFGCSKEPSH